MSEKRLAQCERAKIVKMRGLGYSQAEIAEPLGVSQSAIQYQLARINKQARKYGDDDVFISLLASENLEIAGRLILAKLLKLGYGKELAKG